MASIGCPHPRRSGHTASQSGPESGHKPGSWIPGPVFFMAGTTTSGLDFRDSRCPGKTRPWAGGTARACFNGLVWGYMGAKPCLSFRKAELLCGEPPPSTPEIWAASGPGAHRRNWLLPVECGSWVLDAQLYRDSDKYQMRWWKIWKLCGRHRGSGTSTSEIQR